MTPPVWCAPPDSCVRFHQRISVAWCKQFDVPLNKVLTKTLLEKFTWATHVEADFEWKRVRDLPVLHAAAQAHRVVQPSLVNEVVQSVPE
jgi:hypothetical protein